MPTPKKYVSLSEIFADEEFHLIEEQKKTSAVRSADERLQASFEEINDFVRQKGHEPTANMNEIAEYQLYARLKGLREDAANAESLKEFDRFHLLAAAEGEVVEEPTPKYEKPKAITSLDELLEDDELGLLIGDDAGLFEFKHTPKETSMPDYVSSRKPCEEFEQYEPLLKQCQQDLREGKRSLKVFKNEQQINQGSFFVLKGVLLYVAEVGEREMDQNRKTNARLLCIFENGTESDMLLRSLAAELYKDGRRVTAHQAHLLDNFNNITAEDQAAGYIYLLRSKSTNESLRSISDLYKIGYSRTEVPERIKHAEREPTYLMAPVEYVAGWECYNMNPQKFEQLIHNFFGSSCLEIDVFDERGKRHTPREWFIVPMEIIEEAIGLIISGEIVAYRYESESQAIVKK